MNFSVPPRIRFAPNTSGPLHLGNARTALVAYEMAKKLGIEFHLRFDDDPAWASIRSREERQAMWDLERSMMAELAWLGIKWDSVYRLSDRTGLALWAMDSLQDKFGRKPYLFLRDMQMLPTFISFKFAIIVSFFDDLFSNTTVHVRGYDLKPQEQHEYYLHILGGNVLKNNIPEYFYLPLMGDSSTWHKSNGKNMTLTQCIAEGYSGIKVRDFLLASFNTPIDNWNTSFWKSINNCDFTLFDADKFLEAVA